MAGAYIIILRGRGYQAFELEVLFALKTDLLFFEADNLVELICAGAGIVVGHVGLFVELEA